MAKYRVYEAYENEAGSAEGCGTGSDEIEAATPRIAAIEAAEEWDWGRDDWDGGDVIVATDDEGESYHLHRSEFLALS